EEKERRDHQGHEKIDQRRPAIVEDMHQGAASPGIRSRPLPTALCAPNLKPRSQAMGQPLEKLIFRMNKKEIKSKNYFI
ncbi:MAG: hypothetical protein OEU92_30595, partial [Alphaproteobacteria bacterium]|nr:hypothetical protein [Alphaproteobacteria bacterium]